MKQLILIAGFFFLLIQPMTAQTDSIKTMRSKSGAEKKIMEIKKIFPLSPSQEQALKKAYTVSQQQSDSILFNVSDPTQAAILKYQSEKQLKETLMATLTEEQQIQYLTVTATPDVLMITEAKVQLLRESGEYTEEELSQKHKEIFDYLIVERIASMRDRFNIAKQRDSIHRLKKVQPASLSESDTLEKMKAEGRVNNGKVKW